LILKGTTMLKNLLMPEIKELIENKKWYDIKEVLSEWPSPDIADLIESLDDENKIIIFRLLPKDIAAEVLIELGPDTEKKLIEKLTNRQIKEIINELSTDDRTGLFEELPDNVVERLLELLSPEEKNESLSILSYPENSVGRLITTEYLSLKPEWYVEEAIDHIRRVGNDVETIDIAYVVDNKKNLLGLLSIKDILLAKPKTQIKDIMEKEIVFINVMEDQEKAANLMKRYDLSVLPVVDNNNKLIGIVTIDDIVDVIEEEQTEDFTKISSIHANIKELEQITDLLSAPFRKLYKSRIFWLFALLIMDIFTGGIIISFEETIAKYIILTAFLPVLVDTAGNAGSQAATLVIRAMALGTVTAKDWIKLLLKEAIVATLLGISMALGISIMGFIRGGTKIATVVVISMFVNVFVGSLIGVILPFIFAKLKKDPATASTPLITTFADIFGTAIFLAIAKTILG